MDGRRHRDRGGWEEETKIKGVSWERVELKDDGRLRGRQREIGRGLRGDTERHGDFKIKAFPIDFIAPSHMFHCM